MVAHAHKSISRVISGKSVIIDIRGGKDKRLWSEAQVRELEWMASERMRDMSYCLQLPTARRLAALIALIVALSADSSSGWLVE